MSNKKIFLSTAIIVAMLLAGCSPSAINPEPTNQLVSIKIGVLPYISNAPLYIAQQEGFFSDQGLDADLILFNQTNEMVTSLIQGDLDVIIGGVTPGILNAIAQGGNIKFTANKGIFDPDLECSVSAFMARNELLEPGYLSNPENIKGLKVADTPGSIFDYAFDLYLNQHGLTKADIEQLSFPPPPTLVESLSSGAVDVGPLSEPWVTRTLNTGKAGIWFPLEDILPYYDLALILYGPSLLENVDIGGRFMVAYLNAVRFYAEGKTDRNIELVAEFTQLSPEEVESACWQTINLDGHINVDLILEFEQWLLENGYIDSIVSPEQFWDSQFIDYANQVIN